MTSLAATSAARGVGAEVMLSVRQLGVRFGPLVALRGVDLEVRRGEVVALAGENGAGKTTLVRCIAGDLLPTSGEIYLHGHPIGADPAAVARQGVSVVWQDLALCDNLDVASNLLLGSERRFVMRSEARLHAMAAELLDGLHISLRDTTRSVGSLSGGQRQLLAVARAMRDEPRLLLLDEPTAAVGANESAEVERLILEVSRQGATVVVACHDIEQMFRLADRLVILRNGRVVAEADPSVTHPDEVVALMSGQEVDSSARHQLIRLHGLVDQLASADRSSSLPLILSTLSSALGAERLCVHLVAGGALHCVASLGLPQGLLAAWSQLPYGPPGGAVGISAATEEAVVVDDARTSPVWSAFRDQALASRIGSSWTMPMTDSNGLIGVLTILPSSSGRPRRDELDLVTLYAGYVASAMERDRLFDDVTTRNRVLETIREVLETLAGPVAVGEALAMAVRALRAGLQADEVALVLRDRGGDVSCRAADAADGRTAVTDAVRDAALDAFSDDGRLGVVGPSGSDGSSAGEMLGVTFSVPGGHAALLARWSTSSAPDEAHALIGDAAHSLRLALEREEVGAVHQEAAALRRSHELQRDFLSRLSHELRTPLTAIRGYASSLMQPDVTWDGASQQRFLARIATESARLGRLVGDLLDFSAIESGVLRLQLDWCDLRLVLEAAAGCLPPEAAAAISLSSAPQLPVVWADHDRLEQVFVNLMDNALRHNPAGTTVTVRAEPCGEGRVAVVVRDDGSGLHGELASAPFGPGRRRSSPTAGTGLGLSIARGIVDAHLGTIELMPTASGTAFRIELPVEGADRRSDDAAETPAGEVDPLATETPGPHRATVGSVVGHLPSHG